MHAACEKLGAGREAFGCSGSGVSEKNPWIEGVTVAK